jgi:hypothetical protein
MTTSKEPLQSVFNRIYSVSDATRGMYFFEKELRAMCNRALQRKVDILIRNRVYLELYDHSFEEMVDHMSGDIFNDKG